MERLLLPCALLLLASCGKEEPLPEVAAEPAVQDQPGEAAPVGTDPTGAGTAAAEAATDGTEGPGAQAAAGDAGSGSLRDRIKVTPPEPEVEDPYYSNAVSVEERKGRIARALERAGETGDVILDIHDLGGWEFDERLEQPFPEYVRALEGRTVVVRGFMMPDIDFEHIRKFHLVRSLWGCCFGAPPRINEIVRVVLADKDGMDYTYNTLEVRGTFRTAFEYVDGMIDDVYRIDDATVKVRAYEDPQAPSDFDASTGFDGIIPAGADEY